MRAQGLLTFRSDRDDLLPLLLIAGVALLVAAVYAQTFASMAGQWQHTDFRYGPLVFPIAAYLLWRCRHIAARARLEPWPAGLAILCVLVLSWLVFRAAGVEIAQDLIVMLLIPAAVATLLGVSMARRTLFPLLFLVAAVPIGDSMVPYLVRATADLATLLLRGVGVPVFREGAFLSLPGGEFQVADTCAGLRYLVAGTMIATLFAYLTYRSNLKRVVFVAIAALILIPINGIRAFTVMLVASATHMRIFGGRDHIFFGWLLFGAVVMTMFWIGARYADADDVKTLRGRESGGGLPTIPLILVLGLVMLATTARPLQAVLGDTWFLILPAGVLLLWVLYRKIGGGAQGAAADGGAGSLGAYAKLRSVAIVCAGTAVLAAGPALVRSTASTAAEHAEPLQLPNVAACGVPAAWAANWRPQVGTPEVLGTGTYVCAGQPVNVFVAGYAQSAQGRELVNENDHLIPTAWRRYVTKGKSRFRLGEGRSIEVNEVVLRAEDRHSLIWYWYGVGDRTALGPLGVKAWEVYQLITGRRAGGNIYLLETPIEASLGSSRRRLAAIARELTKATHAATAKTSGGATS